MSVVLAPGRRTARVTRGATARRMARAPRPLDDATSEIVRVIGFVLRAGDGVQPVILLERRLLD